MSSTDIQRKAAALKARGGTTPTTTSVTLNSSTADALPTTALANRYQVRIEVEESTAETVYVRCDGTDPTTTVYEWAGTQG